MSQKRKNQRANHDAQEKRQAEKVIVWIFGILVILAIGFAIYTITL